MSENKVAGFAPFTLLALGLLFVLLATLAVTQTSGISVSPGGGNQSGPKLGQLTFNAPPYCTSGPLCVALDRVIHTLRRLATRFPNLGPIFNAIITRLQVIQTRLPHL
jgi:hypothetical protein